MQFEFIIAFQSLNSEMKGSTITNKYPKAFQISPIDLCIIGFKLKGHINSI